MCSQFFKRKTKRPFSCFTLFFFNFCEQVICFLSNHPLNIICTYIFFPAQAGAKKVYAVEASTKIANLAEEAFWENNCDDIIEQKIGKIEGCWTFQPRICQLRASTMDFSTMNSSTMRSSTINSSTMKLSTFWLQGKSTLNPGLFNPKLQP